MKQFKTLLIAAILLLGATQISNAQTKVEKLSGTYDADYKKMVEEYQTKLKSYEAEATKVTEAVNQERSKEVQDMQKRITDFRDNAQKELQTKNDAIVKPIMEKVRASIQKVGKAKGFQYVLDGATLLLADGTNITADVKKDLGF